PTMTTRPTRRRRRGSRLGPSGGRLRRPGRLPEGRPNSFQTSLGEGGSARPFFGRSSHPLHLTGALAAVAAPGVCDAPSPSSFVLNPNDNYAAGWSLSSGTALNSNH